MKNCDEMVESLMNRRTKYEKKKQVRRQIMMGLAPITLGLVIIGVKVALPKNSPNNAASENTTMQSTESHTEAPTNGPTMAPIDTTQKPTVTPNADTNTTVSGFPLFLYDAGDKKLSLYGSLYQALTNNPQQTQKIRAWYRPTTSTITSFTYEGQTLSEIAIAVDEEWITYQNMSMLLKFGDELKYGTALYETGAPDGTKWAKEFYENTVKQLDTLLDTYIVDGTFKKDELQKDIDNFSYPAKNKYASAYSAYMKTIIPKAQKKLADNKILYEVGSSDRTYIIFYANADNIKSVDFDDLNNWAFDLAEHDTTPTDYADATTTQTVKPAITPTEKFEIEKELCEIVCHYGQIYVPFNDQSPSTEEIILASYYGRDKVLISKEDYTAKLGYAIAYTKGSSLKEPVSVKLPSSTTVDYTYYYSEEAVKETYNKIFGANSYEGFGEVGEIYYGNTSTYTYAPEIKGFVIISDANLSSKFVSRARFDCAKITDTKAELYYMSAITLYENYRTKAALTYNEYMNYKKGNHVSYIAQSNDYVSIDDIFSKGFTNYDLFKFTFEKDSAGNYVFTAYEKIDPSEWPK